jgi:hypothetical protein
MTPDQVLRVHKDNFAIDYAEVVSVKVEQTDMLAKITIFTTTDKFEFSSRSRFAQIVEIFSGKLGDRLTVQRLRDRIR